MGRANFSALISSDLEPPEKKVNSTSRLDEISTKNPLTSKVLWVLVQTHPT